MRGLRNNGKIGVGLAVTGLLLGAGSAFAQSSVQYTLQLGGDNHAEDIKTGIYVLFTPGSSAGDEEFPAGTQLTWSALLEASGVQDSGPGAGSAIKGAANFVVDLELRHDSPDGPIVNQEIFYSSIHDGGDECVPVGGVIPEGLCPPCLAGAAFAFSFNLWDISPSRVVDPPWRGTGGASCPGYPDLPAGGGPNMKVCLFPTVEPGRLLGMGAGYQQWQRSPYVGTIAAEEGVGLADGGLGVVPVIEGQIDTTGLSPGTYVLKLIPKPGTNVLRGDLDLSNNQAAFATAAEEVTGDTITFVVTDPQPCQDPIVLEAASVMTHGAAGEFTLAIALAEPYAIEMRRGTDHRLEFVFDQEIDIADADVALSSGEATLSLAGTHILVATMTTLPDNNDCLTITVSGVKDATGICVMAPVTVYLTMIQGEVDDSPPVNLTDMSIVRADLYQPVNSANFMSDVNADGVINLTDMSLVRDNLYQQAICP